MFTPDGDTVCKVCFYADDTKRKDEGATRALVSAGYGGILFGIVVILLGVLARTGRGAALGVVLIAGGVGALREARRRSGR
jgi:hypothetical protein